jgi:flavodoxin
MSKTLIVYYSHTDNTQEIAKQIQTATDGDIFEIKLVNPYPSEYHKIMEQTQQEINIGFKPTIKGGVENIKTYDTIFIGSPYWGQPYLLPSIRSYQSVTCPRACRQEKQGEFLPL